MNINKLNVQEQVKLILDIANILRGHSKRMNIKKLLFQ